MLECVPCIWFDKNGEEAAELYCSIFENSRIESNGGLTVEFVVGGRKFLALNGGPMYRPTPAISITVILNDKDKVREAWDKLCVTAMMPLGDSYGFSPLYGWCADKFGLTWQLRFDDKATTSISVFPSLMFCGPVLGKAEEAMKLYTSLLEKEEHPETKIIDISRHQQEDQGVLYASFKLLGGDFSAMDSPGPHPFTFSPGFSLMIYCDSQEQVDRLWDSLLADGGRPSHCGWLSDKFGVSWQIIPRLLITLMKDENKEKAGKVQAAMMKMIKLDSHALQAAYDSEGTEGGADSAV